MLIAEAGFSIFKGGSVCVCAKEKNDLKRA